MNADKPLIVEFDGDCLNISVGKNILIHALKYGLESYLMGDVEVTDIDGFVKDIVRELEDEEEDGSTPVHRMLDKAGYSAIEQGSEYVEYTEEGRYD